MPVDEAQEMNIKDIKVSHFPCTVTQQVTVIFY